MNKEDDSMFVDSFPKLTDAKGKPIVYLDSAATTQKPFCVLDAAEEFYRHSNANIHRGAHYLSRIATEQHEQARETVALFLHARSSKEIIFTSGTTMGINLVAQTLCLSGLIGAGDEVLVTTDAHHSNIVPWQMLCQRVGATLRPIPLTAELTFDMETYLSLLTPHTKLVAVPYISNALGAVNPVREIIAAAKRNNPDTLVLVDGAQSTAHTAVDVQSLGCDFYAFSGHKIYAPTGTGALWGREEILSQLPPWQGGGEMIAEVTFAKTTYNELPFKYEAGTPNIGGNIVLGKAIEWMQSIGLDKIDAYEQRLTAMLYDGLSAIDDVQILGPRTPRGSLVSIVVPGVHHYDLGTLLDQMGIAVRTGHHCCQPFMQSQGITGTTRYSIALSVTEEDIQRALTATTRALNMLR